MLSLCMLDHQDRGRMGVAGYATLRYAMRCDAMPCHAMPCLALPCLALLCLAMPGGSVSLQPERWPAWPCLSCSGVALPSQAARRQHSWNSFAMHADGQ